MKVITSVQELDDAVEQIDYEQVDYQAIVENIQHATTQLVEYMVTLAAIGLLKLDDEQVKMGTSVLGDLLVILGQGHGLDVRPLYADMLGLDPRSDADTPLAPLRRIDTTPAADPIEEFFKAAVFG